MKIDILLTTYHKNHKEILDLLKHLNIKSSVIVGNQTNNEGEFTYKVDGSPVLIVETNDKGVSKNRNNILKYSKADIVIFADDDEIFTDDAISIIEESFNENKEADAIYFSINIKGSARPVRLFQKSRKAKWKDISPLGVWGLAIKTSAIKNYNLEFDTNFGPGSKNSMGEDSIYLKDCYDSRMNLFTSTKTIATIEQTQSTWFKGYDDDYFINLGQTTKRIYKNKCRLKFIKYTLYYLLKFRKNPLKVHHLLLKGSKLNYK